MAAPRAFHWSWAFKATFSILGLVFQCLLFLNGRRGSKMTPHTHRVIETHLWSMVCWFHADHNVYCSICISWIRLFRTHNNPQSLLCCSFHRWGNWDLQEISHLPKVMRVVYFPEVYEPVNEKKAHLKKKKAYAWGSGDLLKFSRMLKFHSLWLLPFLQMWVSVDSR